MPITSQQLKSWATGMRSDAVPASKAESGGNPMEDVVHDDEMADELELEKGPGNPIWSGEVPGDEVTDEMAEELVEWLGENEPEVGAAVVNMADAVETMDVAKMEAAKDELKQAAQFLNPEYQEFTAAERTVAPAAIESRVEGGKVGNPGPEMGAEEQGNPMEPGEAPPKPGMPPKPGAKPNPGEKPGMPPVDAGPPPPKTAVAAGIADVRHAGGPVPGPAFEDLPEGWTPASREKFYKSVGGSFDICVEKMKGEGLQDPEKFCGALKGQEEGPGV